MNPTSLSVGPPTPELIGQLLDRHAPALALYARQLCSTPDDAVQEAFVALAAQSHTPDDPPAWLFCAVRNAALSAARASRRRRTHEQAAAQVRASAFDSSPGDRLDAAAAVAALERLEALEREIVVARIWGQLTFLQIGRLTGMSDSSAQRMYVKALTRLRFNLGDVCRTNQTTSPPS